MSFAACLSSAELRAAFGHAGHRGHWVVGAALGERRARVRPLLTALGASEELELDVLVVVPVNLLCPTICKNMAKWRESGKSGGKSAFYHRQPGPTPFSPTSGGCRGSPAPWVWPAIAGCNLGPMPAKIRLLGTRLGKKKIQLSGLGRGCWGSGDALTWQIYCVST
jgi:hypothetical protein